MKNGKSEVGDLIRCKVAGEYFDFVITQEGPVSINHPSKGALQNKGTNAIDMTEEEIEKYTADYVKQVILIDNMEWGIKTNETLDD